MLLSRALQSAGALVLCLVNTADPLFIPITNETLWFEAAFSHHVDLLSKCGEGYYLRVVPLGASIVWGLTSIDGNG